MTSQVSFKFDGKHNQQLIVNILKKKLKGLKYMVEKESQYNYRIYVASLEDEKKTFDVCYSVQSSVVYDYNREL